MLYHYTNLSTAIEYILPKFELRPNSYFKTNDPRETYVWSFGGINITKENESPIKAAFRIGKDSRKDCKLICFTGDKTNYQNEMMWSHYADKHRGVCLQIDEDEFLKENKSILDNTTFFVDNVNYDKFDNESKPDFVKEFDETHDDALIKFINNNYKTLYFQKSPYWTPENERRLVIYKKGFDKNLSIRNSIKNIFYGLYASENYLPTIFHLIDNTAIRIYQCYLDNFAPKLSITARFKGDYRKFGLKKYLNEIID